MQALLTPKLVRPVAMFVLLLGTYAAFGQVNAYRGLWVGEAKLRYVNEVSVPLDAQNFPKAPDPNVPTPTADAANLLVILHVNGAGQVSLLKDVAIVTASNKAVRTENDVALVTDPRLYSTLPPQPASRIASVSFDFGDHKATELLDAMVEAAAIAVTNAVATGSVSTLSARLATEAVARARAGVQASNIVAKADVTAAFDRFLQDYFPPATVDAVAGAAVPLTTARPALIAATNVEKASVYGDSRAVEMVLAVVAAVQAAPITLKSNAAHNTAAAYADVANKYQRFIAGRAFGEMITGAAASAAQAATNVTASAATIRTAVNNTLAVNDARTAALQNKVPPYRDTRAVDAVERVLDAIVSSAVSFLAGSSRVQTTIASAAEAAGLGASASNVVRYVVPLDTPTVDYDQFVDSNEFIGAAAIAAQAAASGAVSEKRSSTLYTATSLKNAAKAEALNALRSVYGAAARAVRTDLPMVGTFGLGRGDVRLRWEIKQENAAPLGAPALTTTIELPANHPTNPFRHRRNPSHAVGFDVERKVRLDFDGSPTNTLTRAGFGVDRITGVYREEIFGLHKPLGPQPDANPIGLIVEGTFELNRISLVDTLNAQ